MRFIAIIILAISFYSCSMNKMYLQPTEISADAKSMKLSSDKRTTIINFEGENHQPVFLNIAKDTIHYNFTVESVIFQSDNGNMLNGWLLRPKEYMPKATILHFHGNAGCLVSQYELMAPLLQNGFQIFMFDYSGFGFSEGKAKRKNVLKDGLSALDYVKTIEQVKGTKLVIYGQSLGGNLSAVVAAKRQSEIDALVIEGAFSGHKDIAEHFAGFFGKLFVSEKYSSTDYIKKYKKPLLVIHSTEDKTIPFVMGQKIYRNANQPKEFFQIEHGHIRGPIYYSDQIANKINAMLEL